MNVPSISGPRGLFHVFVPGVFLVLNIGVLLSRIADLESREGSLLRQWASSTTLVAGVFIAAGYLAGAVLRLLKTGWADRSSMKMLSKRMDSSERVDAVESDQPKKAESREAFENDDRTADSTKFGWDKNFPYANWLCTRVAKRLGPDVEGFVRLHWSRTRVPVLDRNFVNHWKVLIAARHPNLYSVMMAEEALVRFVASSLIPK